MTQPCLGPLYFELLRGTSVFLMRVADLHTPDKSDHPHFFTIYVGISGQIYLPFRTNCGPVLGTNYLDIELICIQYWARDSAG